MQWILVIIEVVIYIYICTYMRYTGVFNRCKSQVSQQSQLFQALLFFSRSFNFLPGWVLVENGHHLNFWQRNIPLYKPTMTFKPLKYESVRVSEEDPCFFWCIKQRGSHKNKWSYLTATISTPQNLTPWTLRNLATFTSQLLFHFQVDWGKMLAHWESQLNPEFKSRGVACASKCEFACLSF